MNRHPAWAIRSGRRWGDTSWCLRYGPTAARDDARLLRRRIRSRQSHHQKTQVDSHRNLLNMIWKTHAARSSTARYLLARVTVPTPSYAYWHVYATASANYRNLSLSGYTQTRGRSFSASGSRSIWTSTVSAIPQRQDTIPRRTAPVNPPSAPSSGRRANCSPARSCRPIGGEWLHYVPRPIHDLPPRLSHGRNFLSAPG